ncbi:MAG: transposase, partial [Saprospiraceae bacterium]|nr:transposase [Saprospiraceae bacterium]
PEVLSQLPAHFRADYIDRAGYFADVRSSKAQRRLEKCAAHLFDLVDRFRGDQAVSKMHSYKLMARLFSEQCEIVTGEDGPVALKKPADVPAVSLQNPSDPDASYGHKGKGYKASLTETCVKDNAFQVITDVAVGGANQPDSKDIVPVLERLEENGAKPGELFADAGYGSGDNFLDAKASGVDLTAPMTSGSKADENRVRVEDFTFDDDWACVLSCLKNHEPTKSGLTEDGKFVFAVFDQSQCEKCDFKNRCQVKHNKNGKFHFKVLRKTVAAADRRCEQETPDFKERYKIRSGIEATISEANRLTGIKRSWTRGRKRVSSSVIFKAMAINIKRYVAFQAEKARKAAARLLFWLKPASYCAKSVHNFSKPATRQFRCLRIFNFPEKLPLAA